MSTLRWAIPNVLLFVFVFVYYSSSPTSGAAENCTNKQTVTIQGGAKKLVNEGAGPLTLTFERTAAGTATLAEPASIDLTTTAYTADSAEGDYGSLTFSQATFSKNENTTTHSISTRGNNGKLDDFNKTFFVNISTTWSIICKKTLPTVVEITIQEVDKVTLGFDNDYATYNENAGAVNLKLYNKNDTIASIPIKIRYYTTSGTAIGGKDYIEADDTVQMLGAETSIDITNATFIMDNTVVEGGQKCFNVSIKVDHPNIIYKPQQKKVCILDDDKGTESR